MQHFFESTAGDLPEVSIEKLESILEDLWCIHDSAKGQVNDQLMKHIKTVEEQIRRLKEKDVRLPSDGVDN